MTKDSTLPTVIQQLTEKRSYLIKTNDNIVYRITQVHLKPYTPEKKINPPELYKKTITKVLIIIKDLNVVLNCLTDSIYNNI